ncbi:MAG TPA: DUF697 domain-containing protein [Saprospiraceae bacterium]|nr:DUF697 domain-containing protein [Saprospiraceae bacterium]
MSVSKEREKHADSIIRNHIIWSMGAGFIPVLMADVFAVSALQLDMIRQLCKVYDVEFQEVQGKAIVTSMTSSALARVTAGRLVKLIPGIGSWIGGMAVSSFAGASTYALGEVFKKHFSSGGTILDFDIDRLRKFYKEKFEKGKTVVKDVKKSDLDLEAEARFFEAEGFDFDDEAGSTPDSKSTGSSNIVEQLKELALLKEQGAITEEEFSVLKKKLIDG